MELTIAVVGGKNTNHQSMVATNLFATVCQNYNDFTQLIDFYLEIPTDHLFFETDQISIKQIKKNIPIYNKNRCVFCGACAKFCNYKGIIFIKAIPYIQIIDNICRACGGCFYACDHTALKIAEKLLGSITEYKTINNNIIYKGKIEEGIPYALPIIKELKKHVSNDAINILDIPIETPTPLIETIKNANIILLVVENTANGLEQLKQILEIIRPYKIKTAVFLNNEKNEEKNILNILENENIPILATLEVNDEINIAADNHALLINNNLVYKNLFLNLAQSIKQLA